MARSHKSLQGQLLLDGGKLRGSYFHRSVVLICQHDAEGAFGLILNRPTEHKVGEALVANLSDAIREQPLFDGGPVQPGSLSFLHAHSATPQANVMLNLTLDHSIEALTDLSESALSAQPLKLFSGYAGWTAGQLDQEMARKSWLTHPASLELVFHPKPSELWKEIMRQKDDWTRLWAESPDDLSWN